MNLLTRSLPTSYPILTLFSITSPLFTPHRIQQKQPHPPPHLFSPSPALPTPYPKPISLFSPAPLTPRHPPSLGTAQVSPLPLPAFPSSHSPSLGTTGSSCWHAAGPTCWRAPPASKGASGAWPGAARPRSTRRRRREGQPRSCSRRPTRTRVARACTDRPSQNGLLFLLLQALPSVRTEGILHCCFSRGHLASPLSTEEARLLQRGSVRGRGGAGRRVGRGGDLRDLSRVIKVPLALSLGYNYTSMWVSLETSDSQYKITDLQERLAFRIYLLVFSLFQFEILVINEAILVRCPIK